MARARLFPAAAPEVLNRVVLYLCLPALILIHVPTLEPAWSLLPLVIIPWLLLAATVAVILPLARVLGLSREVTASLLVLIPLGNTSFLGFPLIEALLGPEFIRLAVVYDQFGSFLIVCTHVLFVVGWYGEGENPSVKTMAKRIAGFPPFIALIVALAIGNAWLPAWGESLVHRFADMLLPLVTLAIGMSLKLRLVPDYRLGLLIGLIGKLLILPALAMLLAVLLGARVDVATVAVLESAMPPMITAAALLASARLAPALGSAMVAWGVLISAVTVPAWFWLCLRLFGPI
ncbi:MAG: AEC family transporter [Wenzhouxiangella sp.]|nr:AEC family transporter [Wenzhouxiangella sp.]TVR95465.1 MAG: AEC family transporter [Wenzhouxiangellaceae bacterium]